MQIFVYSRVCEVLLKIAVLLYGEYIMYLCRDRQKGGCLYFYLCQIKREIAMVKTDPISNASAIK